MVLILIVAGFAFLAMIQYFDFRRIEVFLIGIGIFLFLETLCCKEILFGSQSTQKSVPKIPRIHQPLRKPTIRTQRTSFQKKKIRGPKPRTAYEKRLWNNKGPIEED